MGFLHLQSKLLFNLVFEQENINEFFYSQFSLDPKMQQKPIDPTKKHLL